MKARDGNGLTMRLGGRRTSPPRRSPFAAALLALLVACFLFAAAAPAGASTAPGKPTAKAPKGTIAQARPTFTWSNAARATKYELRAYRGKTQVLKKTGLTKLSWKSSKALPKNVKLTWKVRGSNARGAGAWSKSLTFKVVPAAGPTQYLVISSSYGPVAGTIVTISAQLADAVGNPVATAGKLVTWTKSGAGGSFAAATSSTNAGGLATVAFTTHTVAGTLTTVTATDGASLTGTSPGVTTIAGAADATASTLTPASASITVLGCTQVLTVTAKDANSNSLSTGGGAVTITNFSGAGTIGGVSDNGNGTYTASVTSPSNDRNPYGVFVATLGGAAVKGGTASQTQSTITYIASVAIGNFSGGGVVAYIVQSGDPGYNANLQHGLIAAVADKSLGIQWWNGSFTVTGAPGTELGTGLVNTYAIIAAQGGAAGSYAYAAGVARDYAGGGYADWYLPSKDELNKLFLSRDTIGGFDLGPGGDPSWGSGPYWSSSEVGAQFAWAQYFSAGVQHVDWKSGADYRVRAVRTF